MITVKQQQKLINRFESLTELEVQSVLVELADFIRKNKYEHLIVDVFSDEIEDAAREISSEELEDTERELRNIENERDKLKDQMNEITSLCEGVEDIESFEENAVEDLQKAIKEIKSISE